MDPLRIGDGAGKLVDAFLTDLEPGRNADLLADVQMQSGNVIHRVAILPRNARRNVSAIAPPTKAQQNASNSLSA